MFQPIVVANYGTAAGGTDIISFTLNSQFDTSTVDSQPVKLSYGSFQKLYILGDGSNRSYQWLLNGTYNNDYIQVQSSSGYRGISFDADFTGVFYIAEGPVGTTYPVASYPGDLSSSVRTFLFNQPTNAGFDIRNFKYIHQLGTFWQLDIGNDALYEVDTNGSFTGNSIDISGESGNARGLTYDGSQFWITDITNDEAYSYSWDAGTGTGAYTGNSVDISSYADICVDIAYVPFTDQFFLINYNANKTVSIVDVVRG